MKTYVIVSDIHCPYHCVKYVDAVHRLISKLKTAGTLKGIVQLGDFVDFWQISSYPKDPSRKNTVAEDLDSYVKVMNKWASALPKGGEFHQIEGNHEARLQRFVSEKAAPIHEFVGSVKSYLKERWTNKAANFFWHDYRNWKSCVIGGVTLTHGYYYNQHVAMTMLAKYRRSIICGHTHRFQYVADGEHFACTLGHGSDEHQTAHQPTPTGWHQAAGVLTLDDKIVTFEPVLIRNGVAYYGGRKV